MIIGKPLVSPIFFAFYPESVYSTRLYANAGSCTFYELRQIVEQNMTARGLSLASLEVIVDYGNGTESVTGKYIIFSRYRNSERSDILFLESHFLVNRTYYVIPRSRYGSVSFFATAGENISPYVDCVFDNGETLRNYRLGQSFSHLNRPNVYSFSLSPSSIKAQVDNIEGGDYGKLLSFTLHVGQRSITVYVVDDDPCAEFTFCNSFNAQEKLFVFGTTTLKTEISQKEAVSMDITSFYDKSVSRKWPTARCRRCICHRLSSNMACGKITAQEKRCRVGTDARSKRKAKLV